VHLCVALDVYCAGPRAGCDRSIADHVQAASRSGCGKADTDQLVDERLFQRDKEPQRARLPLCEAECEGRWKLLQGAQVRYRHERDAKELALGLAESTPVRRECRQDRTVLFRGHAAFRPTLADRTHDVGVVTTVVAEVLTASRETNLLEIDQAFRDGAAAAYLVATRDGFEVVLGLSVCPGRS